jgi:hypothetical protein
LHLHIQKDSTAAQTVVRAAAAFKRSVIDVRNQARKLGTPFPSI